MMRGFSVTDYDRLAKAHEQALDSIRAQGLSQQKEAETVRRAALLRIPLSDLYDLLEIPKGHKITAIQSDIGRADDGLIVRIEGPKMPVAHPGSELVRLFLTTRQRAAIDWEETVKF